jgi:hypothetical protein
VSPGRSAATISGGRCLRAMMQIFFANRKLACGGRRPQRLGVTPPRLPRADMNNGKAR